MRIAVGSDHAGFEGPGALYKPAIIKHVRALGHEVVDCGTDGPEAVDYPDVADKVAKAVQKEEVDGGILMCGTGIGMSMAANRHAGVRAATCATPDMARLAREHNNANVLCIGRRILPLGQCLELVDIFLATPFSEAKRHRRRVAMMG